ncbi:NACHT domain-containing protein, partial [Reticulomyxa filosa]
MTGQYWKFKKLLVVWILQINFYANLRKMDKNRCVTKFLVEKDLERFQKRIARSDSATFEATKAKLKEYYKSQDKLVPLFDDHEQSINACYIRLALLNQKRFLERKEQITKKMRNNEERQGKCTNTLDYPFIYDDEQETIEEQDNWNIKEGELEVQDIWNTKEGELEVRHISIRGEAGCGKSVLTQRIAYLWANDQMWNNRFQWLLHIPFRKISHIFDNKKNNNTNNIKDQWSKIVAELNIPQWNQNNTNIVYSKNGLLILDGFDEIANELNQKPGMQQWLQYCTGNINYSIIITSRPNAMCSYLRKPRLFNVIGFQSQDIRKYVYAYFQNVSNDYNDNHCQTEILIKKLNNNPNLKLLSHTPLYLRLLCFFARQQTIKEQEKKEEKDVRNKSELDELNNISISKLYKKLLECYMKWNWIKFNGTKDKPNEQNMFSIFEMEIDYLSRIAWEGLKYGQAIISCEIQQKVLYIINNKYPREHISVMSQWSRIHSFGFLQGQESMNPLYPIDSVYFPHLTFQEWFSAYYLVNCLYQSNETKEHQEVCSILINEQITPKYAMMIPFMAGILYDNIENGKDSSGSGLLYFWKLLHFSPPQLTPIHQTMLYIRCLDACKADAESPFLSSQLRDCHRTIIHSFKSWLIAWITFDKDIDYIHNSGPMLIRPLNNVMTMHLPTLQYVLVHPDIHSCIIEQLIQFKSRILQPQNGYHTYYNRWKRVIDDGLYLLSYLCISTETSDIVLQCLELTLRRGFHGHSYLYRAILMKLKEDQLDGVFKFLTTALSEKDIHTSVAETLIEVASKLNERQEKDVVQIFMNELNCKNDMCSCVKLLSSITVKLRAEAFEGIFMKMKEENLNVVLRHLSKKLHSNDFFVRAFEYISVKLNERQLKYSVECLIDGLNDKNIALHQECVKLLIRLSIKWSQGQLNSAFKCFLDRLNGVANCRYTDYIKNILMQLKGEYLDSAFQYLINGIDSNQQRMRKVCVNFLAAAPIRWNKVQLDTVFICLMTKYVRYSCAKTIQKLLLQLDDKQINNAFDYLISGFKDKNKSVQYSCAESLGKITQKLNQNQLNIAFQLMIKKLNNKNEDILVRMSCAESLGSISMKLNQIQLNNTLKYLMEGLNDEKENRFVRKYCAHSIERLLMKLDKINKNACIRVPLKQSLKTVLTKFKEKQFNYTFMLLCNEPKDEDGYIRSYCVKELKKFLLQLNGQQFNTAFKVLVDGLKDKHKYSCAIVIYGVALELNRTQMNKAFKYLLYGLKDEDVYVRTSCMRTLKILALKLKRKQLTKVFKYLVYDLNNENGNILYPHVNTLETFVIKLNDKQLYLLTKYCLQILKKRNEVIRILSSMSENMWQRVVMHVLKRNISTKKNKFGKKYPHQSQLNDVEMEILAFAIEWGFPIKQKWHVDDAILHPCCNNLSDTSKRKGRYNIVCESAQSGNMFQLVSALKHHRIDINDAFNEYGHAPLLLAINYKHWDIARYCIGQGAWIDVRGGTFDEITLQTSVECIVKKIGKEKKDDNLDKTAY